MSVCLSVIFHALCQFCIYVDGHEAATDTGEPQAATVTNEQGGIKHVLNKKPVKV